MNVECKFEFGFWRRREEEGGRGEEGARRSGRRRRLRVKFVRTPEAQMQSERASVKCRLVAGKEGDHEKKHIFDGFGVVRIIKPKS